MTKNAFRPRFFALLVLLLGPRLALGIEFQDLGLLVNLQNAYYKVSSVKESREPGFVEFEVRTGHANYRAEGVLELGKLLRETEFIEKVRRHEESSGFFDGAASSVQATADGFVNLVTSPIESGKGIGRAAGKLGQTIGGAFRPKEEGEKVTFNEKFLGGSERELAKQFGVDVYTRNAYVRQILTNMARSRMGGKGALFFAKLLVPVALAASIVLTASGVNSSADRIVNDYDKGDLYRMNRKALLDLKCEAWAVNLFMSSPFYTPREMTYIRVYLETLKNAKGFETILPKAAESRSAWEARKILYASQLAADQVMSHGARLVSIKPWQGGLLAESEDSMTMILPYDYLQNNAHGKNLIDSGLYEFRKTGKKKLQIWNAGQIQNDFLANARRSGIDVRWRLLWAVKGENEKKA